MGQYFKAALVDTEWNVKVINLSGWKLMGHSWYWNHSMMRVEKLLYREAMNVYWIWDYSIMSSLVWKHKFEDEEDKMRWEERYHDTEILQRKQADYYYLVNHYSHEYINMTKQEMNKEYQSSYWRVVHPLPLLCRAETEEAWGGYYSDINREHIWKWCGDEISIYHWENGEELEPRLEEKGYKDMTDIYWFKE